MLPLLEAASFARIVNVSGLWLTEAQRRSDLEPLLCSVHGYNAFNAALNMLTVPHNEAAWHARVR